MQALNERFGYTVPIKRMRISILHPTPGGEPMVPLSFLQAKMGKHPILFQAPDESLSMPGLSIGTMESSEIPQPKKTMD